MAMIVYVGAIVAATAIFIFFILTAFPESAYFIRVLMVLAAMCVGASALAFRYALENWAVYGNHRKAAIGFYYGEIALVGLNTIVSFSVLLYKFSGNNALPDWVAWYEPFTVATIAYVVLAWGTLFVLDPRAKSKARQLQVLIDFDNQVVDGMKDYLRSEDGLLAIQENANERIRKNFSVKEGDPQPWINRGRPVPITTPGIPVRPTLPRPIFSETRYTLDEVLAITGMSREEAVDMINRYNLDTSLRAYNAMMSTGYLPEDISFVNFDKLYRELMSSSPISVPNFRPVPHGGNGKNP